jgi:hypothetical protein
MKNRTFLLWISFLVIFCLLPTTVFMAFIHRGQIDLFIHHQDYLTWKRHGGVFQESFYPGLRQDSLRNDLIRGLTKDQITAKFTNLFSGDGFPGEGYKSSYLFDIRNKTPDTIDIFWLNKDDGFDWAFIIVNGVGQRVELIKG